MAHIVVADHKKRAIEVESYHGAKKLYTLSTEGTLREGGQRGRRRRK